MLDFNSVLAEVRSWSVEDQLRLIEGIQGDLEHECNNSEHPEELKQLLDERLDDLKTHPEDVVSWEEIKAHVRRAR